MSQSDWLGLEGATALVAGAGGIGTAAAIGYADAGARVAVVDYNADRLKEAASAITAAVPSAQVVTIESDLTAPGSGESVVSQVVERLGELDVLLHAVGINDRRPILEFTAEEWRRILTVNLDTAFELAQAAGRYMVAEKHGRIVMLSSVSGLLAHSDHGPYAASKGGMNQMMRVMAREWARDGVTVNAVAPGYVETNLTAEHLTKPGIRDRLVGSVPAGRLGTPEEVVGPILFLSSAQAGFVTGHVVYVDGGRTLV